MEDVPSGTVRLRFSYGLALTLALQTIGLVGWLVQMRTEVTQLKAGHTEMHQLVDRFDRDGTYALKAVQQRQLDVIAANSAQDARIRELENKLSDIQRRQVENSFWVDQLVAFMRAYSHAPIPQSTLRSPLTTAPP